MKEFSNPSGVEWFKLYSGVVVINDDSTHTDGRKLCRVKIRVPVIFDGIEDDDLPWSIPFTDYSTGEHADWGFAAVPAVGSKICIAFQGGSLYHPVYMSHHVDEQVALAEMAENYPHRRVSLLPNRFMIVVDAKSNEVFIRNPGRMSIYILGDADITVAGNLTEKVMGNRNLYVQGDSVEHIEGDRRVHVGGSTVHTVEGDRSSFVAGSAQDSVEASSSVYVGTDSVHVTQNTRLVAAGSNNVEIYAGSSGRWVGGDDGLYATGSQIRTGSSIHDNPMSPTPGSPNAPAAPDAPGSPEKPITPEWAGVRWEQPKDTN